jgi:hypothetical protein
MSAGPVRIFLHTSCAPPRAIEGRAIKRYHSEDSTNTSFSGGRLGCELARTVHISRSMADALIALDVMGIRERNVGEQKGATEKPDQSFLLRPG